MIPFWSAIVQIVPVLALALVLEARLLAARLSRGKSPRRLSRTFWALWLIVTWLMLFSTMAFALIVLMREPSREVAPDDLDNYLFAIVTVINALILVAWVPVSRIANAAMTAVAPDPSFLVPWSKSNRLKRDIHKELENIETEIQWAGDAAREALLIAAQALILEGRAGRSMKHAREQLAAGTLTPAQRVETRKQLREIEDSLPGLRDAYSRSMVTFRKSRDFEDYLRQIERKERGFLRRLGKLRNGTNKARAKNMRKLLRDAAQAR